MTTRYPYFQLNRWCKVGFRFKSWTHLYTGTYNNKLLHYFPVQETISGLPYMLGLTEYSLKLLAKFKDKAYISEGNYQDYVFYLWNKPRLPLDTKTFMDYYFSVHIDGVEKLKADKIKFLNRRLWLVQKGVITKEYI